MMGFCLLCNRTVQIKLLIGLAQASIEFFVFHGPEGNSGLRGTENWAFPIEESKG